MRLFIFRGCGSNGSNELRGVLVVSATDVEEAISLAKEKIKNTIVDCDIVKTPPSTIAKTIWYIKDEFESPTEESKIVFSDWFFVS